MTAAASRITQRGRRERQIIDIIYRRGRATIAEVLADLTRDEYERLLRLVRLLKEARPEDEA